MSEFTANGQIVDENWMVAKDAEMRQNLLGRNQPR